MYVSGAYVRKAIQCHKNIELVHICNSIVQYSWSSGYLFRWSKILPLQNPSINNLIFAKASDWSQWQASWIL